MLSRLSSFSGPLSKLFNTIKGFTLNGLILRYELKDSDSYSGTSTVSDLVGNSNASLVDGPTFSSNGYLNFDGTNDHLMTSTSLNSELNPPNTSTIISYFVWVYLQDNGVIVTEQGLPNLNTNWHDSQIEMVSGVLKFGTWNGTSITRFDSSISVSLNKWHYLGLTYDGSTLRGYVNGQYAGFVNVSRVTPYNSNNVAYPGLHYAIAGGDTTNMGDGTFAKMKLGAFHVYNTALTSQQVLNNYNTQRSNYIHTDNLLIWIDANDPESFSGGNIFDLSGNGHTHSLVGGATTSFIEGIKCFDSSSSNFAIDCLSTGPTTSTSGYTYVCWAFIQSDSTTYRTLYRSDPNDHALIINLNTNNLGMFDNDTFSFVDSGYDISNYVGRWAQWTVVGDDLSSYFYINDLLVGSASKGISGNKHNVIGNTSLAGGQPFGYIGNVMLYDAKMTQNQVKQNYDALKHLYVSTGLMLDLDATSNLSYPGTGVIWYDTSGFKNHAVLRNSTTYDSVNKYFTFGGVSDYISITHSTTMKPSRHASTGLSICQWISADDWTAGISNTDYKTSISCTQGGGYAHYIWTGTLRSYLHVNGSYRVLSVDVSTLFGFHCVITTFDGQYIKLYLNGILSDTLDLESSGNLVTYDIDNSIIIGAEASGGTTPEGDYWDGKIGQTRVYNRSISEEQILDYYNSYRSVWGGGQSFTTVGTTNWTAPQGVTTVEYLVVGGGGGGGNGYDSGGGAGGGGGMVLTGTISVIPGQSYTVTVGAGGSGGADTRTNNNGSSGGDSVFSSITAFGGGFGQGSRVYSPTARYTGGDSQITNVSAAKGGGGGGGGGAGGGGGGAGGAGTNSSSSSVAGVGGSGISSSLNGSSVIYGAGGNGGTANVNNNDGASGSSNTGKGGGGGSATSGNSGGGGNGGSGIVVIKYNM